MLAALKVLLRTIIHEGNLVFVDARGCRHAFGDGKGPEIVVGLRDRRIEWQLASDPQAAAGVGYMSGRLLMAAGSLYDFLDLAASNIARHPLPPWAQSFALLRKLRRPVDERNALKTSRRNAARHYDIDDRIYGLFLDRDWQYSCAYFAPGVTDLDEAQRAKKRHIASKLALEPDLNILDIGCGWGGLARYLAGVSCANVRGITLSARQLEAARARSGPPGSGAVEFTCEDYREVHGTFDRIVSVGMFEHVGVSNYDTYFKTIARLLADDGVALIHSIGRLDGPAPTNPFIARHIFPGGSLPALSEVMKAIEASGLLITDLEILRLHYAETLRAWRTRFLARRNEAVAIAGEEFARMWEFYFCASEIAFRYQFLMVFQVQLSKRIDALPLTRDYMAAREAELTRREAASKSIAAE